MNYKNTIIITVVILGLLSFFIAYSVEDEMLKALISPLALSIMAVVSMSSYSAKQEQNTFVRESSSMSDNTSNHDAEAKPDQITTLYIGNIPYKASEQEIVNHFENVAKVYSIRLMKDKRTGKRKGFGFIEVPPTSADKVINQMNESIFMERNLIVRPARDKVA